MKGAARWLQLFSDRSTSNFIHNSKSTSSYDWCPCCLGWIWLSRVQASRAYTCIIVGQQMTTSLSVNAIRPGVGAGGGGGRAENGEKEDDHRDWVVMLRGKNKEKSEPIKWSKQDEAGSKWTSICSWHDPTGRSIWWTQCEYGVGVKTAKWIWWFRKMSVKCFSSQWAASILATGQIYYWGWSEEGDWACVCVCADSTRFLFLFIKKEGERRETQKVKE